MTDKTNIIQLMHNAKAQIKSTKLKKLGENKFSGYHYFLPEQIEQLVFEACEKNSLFTKFDLLRNEHGEFGQLTVYATPTEFLVYTMATAIPEIKATNVAQQLGGCVTYTERYLKMTAFGISENDMDFDTPKPVNKEEEKPWLTQGQFDAMKKSIADGNADAVKKAMAKYRIKKDYSTELNNLLK